MQHLAEVCQSRRLLHTDFDKGAVWHYGVQVVKGNFDSHGLA